MEKRWRDAKSYARRAPAREPYDRVLIVCEGGKTEPNYFTKLAIALQLSSVNVRVLSAPGTDPMSIVTFAETHLSENDRVFCVFDRDGHANFDAALDRITALRNRKLQAVVSWPCFEVWVLLHFVYTTMSFTNSGGRSSCENVIREIQRHYATYTKASKTVYDDLASRLTDACARAAQLETHNRTTASNNPATAVHALVRYLKGLRNS
jgi:hypothetical protein